ncbi:MAG: flagellar basal-body MS-ring/collar protein FliF [Mangrovicoccus sp.]|nr:flagellar basal-body MS-ring/collar protein FliF [Mangrovicoccus sp.]
MERLNTLWSSLDPQRRIIAALALVAFFAMAVGLGHAVSRSDLALLYGGMAPNEAGRVLSVLDQRNIPYEVRGGSIFVDRQRRDALRMELAGEGLPGASGSGYELLDSLSGFGTTSQMFDAAYWRAKEGELARTIVSSPHIRDARVHIATPSTSPFRRDTVKSASVAITGRGPIGRETTQAVQFLVAAAVADLSPENVSVIDSQTGRVLAPNDSLTMSDHAADREQALQGRVLRMLEAHVGAGNARVEISIERELRQETLTQRQIDPDSRVIISQDTEEISSQAQNAGSGAVTVASNLPAGDSAGTGEGSQESRAQTRERSNFDMSETRRETILAPGTIKRMTVAVLVNKTLPSGATDNTASALSQPELDALRQLVAAAVGFNEARGDVLTLKALEFSAVDALGSGPTPTGWAFTSPDPWSMIQLAVFAIVTVVLGLFVLRPLLLAQSRSFDSSGQLSVIGAGGEAGFDDALTLENDPVDDGGLPPLEGGLPTLSVVTDFGEDGDPLPNLSPVEQLKDMIENRQPDTLEILRNWMDPEAEGGENA